MKLNANTFSNSNRILLTGIYSPSIPYSRTLLRGLWAWIHHHCPSNFTILEARPLTPSASPTVLPARLRSKSTPSPPVSLPSDRTAVRSRVMELLLSRSSASNGVSNPRTTGFAFWLLTSATSPKSPKEEFWTHRKAAIKNKSKDPVDLAAAEVPVTTFQIQVRYVHHDVVPDGDGRDAPLASEQAPEASVAPEAPESTRISSEDPWIWLCADCCALCKDSVYCRTFRTSNQSANALYDIWGNFTFLSASNIALDHSGAALLSRDW